MKDERREDLVETGCESAAAFGQQLVLALNERHSGYVCSFREVAKNNGVLLNGIMFSRPDSNVSPTVYIDAIYKQHREGKSFAACLAEVENIYNNAGDPKVEVDSVSDFKKLKSRVLPKLINYGRNANALLKECPFIKYMDLAIIFQVHICIDDRSKGCFTVQNQHVDLWGTDSEELLSIALGNAKEQNPTKIRTMFEVISGYMGMDEEEKDDCLSIDQMLQREGPKMFVMNSGDVNGAVSMLDVDAMSEFADRLGKDLVILPSSIHECILLEYEEGMDFGGLRAMVHEVNATQVAPSEFLSDNIYVFDRVSKTVHIIE